MASACRFAAVIRQSSLCTRSNAVLKTLSERSIPPTSFFSSVRQSRRTASRVVSVLGILESMLPLHSIIAAARLKSNIAIDTACWSWLSQDFAIPR